jgi:hypothetical protein
MILYYMEGMNDVRMIDDELDLDEKKDVFFLMQKSLLQ